MMAFMAGLSFGVLVGFLVMLLIYPALRHDLSIERRNRAINSTLKTVVGAVGAGALANFFVEKDVLFGYFMGPLLGALGTYAYLEWRFFAIVRQSKRMPARQLSVMKDLLSGALDPDDPTSEKELGVMLDQLAGKSAPPAGDEGGA